MNWLCLVLLVIAALSSCTAKRSFILNGPKLYDRGENETLVLTVFDVTGSGTVRIRLLNSTAENDVFSEVSVNVDNAQSKTVLLPVPSNIPNSVTVGKLEIVGSIGDYKIHQVINVGFRTVKPFVFTNTDKPIYKEGEKVRIRVLVTDSDLRPHKKAKTGEIWITDPNRIRIAQWLNVSFNEGLIHRELALPEEPVLGRWTIHVKVDDQTNVRTFEVKEYVLPVYDVNMTPPPYLLKNAKNATWKVCAKYTYGKPVRGELVTKLSLVRYHWQKEYSVIENKTEIVGCQNVTLPVGELLQTDGYYSGRGVELVAEVTEEGTGVKMNSSSTVYPTNNLYSISKTDSDVRYFRPGIPLKITMQVKTLDSKPLSGELVKVCMEAVRRKWNDIRTVTDSVNVCKNYTSNEYGYVIFTIPPQDQSTVYINLDVEAAEYYPDTKHKGLYRPRDSFKLSPWFSASGSHIQLERFRKVDCSAFGPDVKVTQRFHITFNESETRKMYYQVISRGDIVTHGDFDVTLSPDDDAKQTDDTYLPSHPSAMCTADSFQWDSDVQLPKYISERWLSLKLTDEMLPKVRVLLYTVRDDGEIVADSTWYDVDPCFANKVEMKFGEEKQVPGAETTIRVTAEPQSLCSVGIVDKSVYILDKGDLLTDSKVNNHLLPLDTSSYTSPQQMTPDYTYCAKKGEGQGYEPAGYLDTISAFAVGGGVVLTDLPLETRPCKKASSGGCYNPPIALGYNGPGQSLSAVSLDSAPENSRGGGFSGAPAPGGSPVITVRTNFPDTWLFDIYKVNDDGVMELNQTMPDSITEWQGEAVCLHPDKGFGLSKPASIVAFQPFFASLTLPYSVIRNETVPIIVSVFNYLKDCLSINVHLDQTEDFVLYNGTLTQNVCVCGDQSATAYFHVKPTIVGIMNVTATAATVNNKEICGNSIVATDQKRSDTLTKPVIVEAEGFLKEETKNTFFCLEDVEGGTLKTEHLLQLPDDAVKDSARAYCSFTGDLMGPTIEGLDRLVRMPTGCGEQNMITLVPNIVVLDYLNATGRLTEKVRTKAINNIEQGYMRQQKYRHPDGSYSAFGHHDKEGSMFLTAFVVRTFSSARGYINIDEDSLGVSVNWILSRQRGNGCFPMVGTVHNKAMKGGVGKDDGTTSSLTAYVLISMLEYGNINKSAIAGSLRCIDARGNPSNYSLALFAYAASLAEDASAPGYLQQLIDSAETEDGYMYWEDSDKSITVETASYAILTLLKLNREGDFQKAALIAKWLTQKRNPYGGFYSTQDTVIALQALGKYGARITRNPLNMGLSIKTDKVDEIYQLNKDNELLTQRINLKVQNDPETNVDIEASGSGCALVQTHLKYHLPTPEPSNDFKLSVQTQKSEGTCEKAEIRICASYNYPNGSNMAIVEVKMVSGYIPVKSTVEELLQLTELEIKRYEFKENVVNLYFATLTENSRCFSFDVNQEMRVLDAKPAQVRVYDYYDNDKALSVPYAIEETCT